MQEKEDRSYGVIPYIHEKGELRFLLIHQHSSLRGDTYWVFPKGHPEAGESPEETARRELAEETQLELAALDTDHPLVIEYDFVTEETLIKKSVTFFLGKAAAKDVTLQEEEVEDAGWFPYEEARAKLTHENTRRLLDEAVAYLKGGKTGGE